MSMNVAGQWYILASHETRECTVQTETDIKEASSDADTSN
jgi:hypothetical protein